MKRLIGVKSHVKPRHILNVEQESRLRIGTWSRIAGLSCNFVVMIVLVPDSTGYLESQSPTVSWYLEGLDEHQGLCSFRTPMVLSSFPQSFRFQRTFATLSTIHQTSSLTSVSTRFYNSVSLIRLLSEESDSILSCRWRKSLAFQIFVCVSGLTFHCP